MFVRTAPVSGALPLAPSWLGAPTQGGAEQAWQSGVGVVSDVCAGVCVCVWVCAHVCRSPQLSPACSGQEAQPSPGPPWLPSGRESPSCSLLLVPTPAPRGVWAVRQLSQEAGSFR